MGSQTQHSVLNPETTGRTVLDQVPTWELSNTLGRTAARMVGHLSSSCSARCMIGDFCRSHMLWVPFMALTHGNASTGCVQIADSSAATSRPTTHGLAIAQDDACYRVILTCTIQLEHNYDRPRTSLVQTRRPAESNVLSGWAHSKSTKVS